MNIVSSLMNIRQKDLRHLKEKFYNIDLEMQQQKNAIKKEMSEQVAFFFNNDLIKNKLFNIYKNKDKFTIYLDLYMMEMVIKAINENNHVATEGYDDNGCIYTFESNYIPELRDLIEQGYEKYQENEGSYNSINEYGILGTLSEEVSYNNYIYIVDEEIEYLDDWNYENRMFIDTNYLSAINAFNNFLIRHKEQIRNIIIQRNDF